MPRYPRRENEEGTRERKSWIKAGNNRENERGSRREDKRQSRKSLRIEKETWSSWKVIIWSKDWTCQLERRWKRPSI